MANIQDVVLSVPGHGFLAFYYGTRSIPKSWSLGEPGMAATASGDEILQINRGLVLKSRGIWAGFITLVNINCLQTDPVGREYPLKLQDGPKEWTGMAKLASRKPSGVSSAAPPGVRHFAATSLFRRV